MGPRFKCLIVDDEKPAHLVLQSHISKTEDLVFTDSAFNGKEAIKLLITNTYDLLFLDIEMPLINGLEVLETLTVKPATIITTSYNQFAFEAYQLDAVDYLLKPISLPRFLKATEKAKMSVGGGTQKKNIQQFITFRLDGILREYPIENILYLESLGNYVKVFFADKSKPIVVYESLKNIVENLTESSLIQAHKSYIINVLQLEKITKSEVILNGGITLPLGRKYELLMTQKSN
jgi:two-component system, LytTR family, response regulator